VADALDIAGRSNSATERVAANDDVDEVIVSSGRGTSAVTTFGVCD
jgi:hypothetical protein